MGPPSYMRSVVDRNVVMRRMTLFITYMFRSLLQLSSGYLHKNTDKIQRTADLRNTT